MLMFSLVDIYTTISLHSTLLLPYTPPSCIFILWYLCFVCFKTEFPIESSYDDIWTDDKTSWSLGHVKPWLWGDGPAHQTPVSPLLLCMSETDEEKENSAQSFNMMLTTGHQSPCILFKWVYWAQLSHNRRLCDVPSSSDVALISPDVTRWVFFLFLTKNETDIAPELRHEYNRRACLFLWEVTASQLCRFHYYFRMTQPDVTGEGTRLRSKNGSRRHPRVKVSQRPPPPHLHLSSTSPEAASAAAEVIFRIMNGQIGSRNDW